MPRTRRQPRPDRSVGLARPLALLLLAAAAACAPRAPESADAGGAPAPAPTPSAGTQDWRGYRAGGNEPFWTLTLGDGTMEFTDVGAGSTALAPRPFPSRLTNGWRFQATSRGRHFVVEIVERRCNDSMSGRPFPHTVEVLVNDRRYSGCGGSTASLLAGDAWRVVRLEEDATSGERVPTLTFGADGALTGSGGCNRFRAEYELTGEGISIGPAAATRMACTEAALNAQETRFFALLEQVTRFDVTADRNLELYANDRVVIVARR